METEVTTHIENVTETPTTLNGDIGQTILYIASIVIGTTGIIGNGLVILVCFMRPLQGITNIVICNQSLIDFLSSLFFMLLYILPDDYRSNLPSNPIAAAFVCGFLVSRYPLWVLAVSSTVNLEYITLERYFAVMNSLKHKIRFTPFRAKLCAIIPWVYGLLHELPWALTHKDRGNSGTCSSQWQHDSLGFAVGIIAPLDHYIVPLLTICFCYTRIFFKLRGDKSTFIGRACIGRDHMMRRASRSVIKTMFIISIVYLICWGPNEFLYLYSNIGGSVDYSGLFHYYTVVSALCNMCVNPIIYMANWIDFREKVWDLLGLKRLLCRHASEDSHTGSGIVSKNFTVDSTV